MSDKASGWVVTVTSTPPGAVVPTAQVWYAACHGKAAAAEAVKKAANTSGATVEVSREMSETLVVSFGLKSGQVKCFD
jgi:hypothetical protein